MSISYFFISDNLSAMPAAIKVAINSQPVRYQTDLVADGELLRIFTVEPFHWPAHFNGRVLSTQEVSSPVRMSQKTLSAFLDMGHSVFTYQDRLDRRERHYKDPDIWYEKGAAVAAGKSGVQRFADKLWFNMPAAIQAYLIANACAVLSAVDVEYSK